MGKQTPIYALHVQGNAKIVDFAGWDMPLHYGSQLQEHHQVRRHVGMFDVSHMGVVDLKGSHVTPYLLRLLANNVDRLSDGKALYSCMLNEQGGVIDDLIVYKVQDDFYRLVINAGTREKDMAWMKKQMSPHTVELIQRTDLAMLAVQGPDATEKLTQYLPASREKLKNLKPFHFIMMDDWMIARTGYTGEEGYEIILPSAKAADCWQSLQALGVTPCGLGARDTLRLEAGLNLYGSDMDETVTPLESNLGWTVIMDPTDRKFIGREALEKQALLGVKRHLIGLVLEGVGIMRNHQKVFVNNHEAGEITSGGYSPTLEKSIALARIAANSNPMCAVEIRQKRVPATVIQPPFVRHGKKLF